MLWHGKNFRGIINKAKEMIFNNTGTNLVSTNVEDAIKEVNSNLYAHSNTTATEITNNLPYTCPSDGYLILVAGNTIGNTVGVSINGVVDAVAIRATAQAWRTTVYVKKGMVITAWSGNVGQIYFSEITLP